MKSNKTGQEDIDYILDYFDFEKVKEVMDALDWQWESTEEETPSIGELRKCARDLLQETLSKGVEHKKDMEISSGGFKALYLRNEDLLELVFVVEELDNGVLLTERIENR